MYTIAIIDDDVYIGNMLEEILRRNGYSLLRAYSGTEALLLLKEYRPDLILLDLMLPGLSGEAVLAEIQDIPVIVISAKMDIDNKVDVLMSGAADYLTKPFDTKELLARIAVQLRTVKPDSRRQLLNFRELKLDIRSHSVQVAESPVHLTKTEYAILKLLMQNPKQVITKSLILDRISQDTPDCMESSLKVHISNLRRKLREINGKDYIEAVWGIGFKLRDD